jgi:DNA polymerase III alpha subunit
MRYNNYHKHTYYSNIATPDCITSPEAYIKRAIELGHNTYFTTEHGFMGNIYEAQSLCNKYGIKPIYGVEVYFVNNWEEKKRGFHLMLVAMTEKGRRQINKIISEANKDGFYYQARINLENLLSLSAVDVIVTTACIASPMFKGDNWAQDFFMPVYKHFGSNFYLEVQDHNDIKQIEYNKKIMALSKKFNIPIIHGCDSHYINEADAENRNLFLKAKEIFYEDESAFVLDYPSSDTILERYKTQGVLTEVEAIQALNNTLIFDQAEPINITDEFKIPKVTNGDSNKLYKKMIAEAWAKEKENISKDRWNEYKEAIKFEVGMVEKCHMEDYFILNKLIIDKAVNEYDAVLTRTGRGSAVSFYTNYLLGFTAVDRLASPVKLYPTRFLTDTRILESRSIPDIDSNFADVAPVIKASKDVLGEDGVYYVVAYKSLQESSAFRLWCKAQGLNINQYNDVAQELDAHRDDSEWEKLIKDSQVFVNVIETIAPSPCSFLLFNGTISEEVGLIRIKNELCACIDGYYLDVYKYLKNDYLTVSVWDTINETYKLLGKPIDTIPQLLSKIDNKVWDIYAQGLTTTVNQADSDFAKTSLKRYKPKSLAELGAFVAAIRPGFASHLDNFLDRKPYTNGVKEMDELLEDSFHYLMYQESLMSFFVWLGIEEKGTYDIIKKISKKKFTAIELEQLKEKLAQGWLNKVGTMEGFDASWQSVQDSARYSFNSSHSICMALDSLYCAYLKSHYPLEYFTVVLTNYSDDIDRTNKLIAELPYFNIKLKDIKFGKSEAKYTMDKNTNCIYKGIESIKYCNAQIADELSSLYNNHYNSFLDLIGDIQNKTSINARQLDILVKLNFFSDFGKNKKLSQIISIYNKFNSCKIIAKKNLPALADEYGLSEYLIKKYSNKETNSQYKEINNSELIKALCDKIENKSLPIIEQIKFENEVLGYINYTNSKIPPYYWIVIQYKTYTNNNKPYITARRLSDGYEVKTKIKKAGTFKKNPFGLYSILIFESLTKENKHKKVGDDWVQIEETEEVLNVYDVLRKENL